jgi:hypothetical protein
VVRLLLLLVPRDEAELARLESKLARLGPERVATLKDALHATLRVMVHGT